MALREIKLVIPQPRALEDRVTVVALEAELVETWGGFTRVCGGGSWRSPKENKSIEEMVRVYTIASEKMCRYHGSPAFSDAALRTIALNYGRKLAQEAVYIVTRSGKAEIVSCTEPTAD